MDKHRVLIIGVGSIGERHLRCFETTGRVQTAICETNAALRTTVAQRYHIDSKNIYHDLDAALQATHDAAVVAVPAHLHIAMSKRLIQADVAVLCEKPLSTSLDGVDELVQLAADRSVVMGVGYTWRSMAVVREAQQAIASGRFGKPVQIAYVGGQHFPTYRPAYREIYYNNRATGGGTIQDAMTHTVNAGEWLVGPIDRLAADAEHLMLDGVEVEDTVHVITRQGGVLGSYCLNQHQWGLMSQFVIMCQKATVRIDAVEATWQWTKDPTKGTWQTQRIDPAPQRDEAYVRQANIFLDALEGNGQVTCTLAEARQTLHVNLAMLKAAETHTWQTIASAATVKPTP